jgi:hypothetical protein
MKKEIFYVIAGFAISILLLATRVMYEMKGLK